MINKFKIDVDLIKFGFRDSFLSIRWQMSVVHKIGSFSNFGRARDRFLIGKILNWQSKWLQSNSSIFSTQIRHFSSNTKTKKYPSRPIIVIYTWLKKVLLGFRKLTAQHPHSARASVDGSSFEQVGSFWNTSQIKRQDRRKPVSLIVFAFSCETQFTEKIRCGEL